MTICKFEEVASRIDKRKKGSDGKSQPALLRISLLCVPSASFPKTE